MSEKLSVDLIDHMGSDLSVVNAARVSFDKESDYICCRTGDPIKGCWAENAPCLGPILTDKDTQLIYYLAKHGHWSPFSHCFLSFRIKAPIFVARQLGKHQVGLTWNEVSRRYVDSEPEFYVPEGWRKRADNVKQGSTDELVNNKITMYHPGNDYETTDTITDVANFVHYYTLDVYDQMLKAGVCPEQARMIFPQSMLTEWIWSGSLYAFARVCKLRLDTHAQLETRHLAGEIGSLCADKFPVSWEALMLN